MLFHPPNTIETANHGYNDPIRLGLWAVGKPLRGIFLKRCEHDMGLVEELEYFHLFPPQNDCLLPYISSSSLLLTCLSEEPRLTKMPQRLRM